MNGNTAETKTSAASGKCHSLAQFSGALERLASVARTSPIQYNWDPARGQPSEEDKDQVFWQVSNAAATASSRAKPAVSMPSPKSARLSFTSDEVSVEDFNVKDQGSFGVVNLSSAASAMVMLIRNNEMVRSQVIPSQSFAIFTNPKETETTVRVVSVDVTCMGVELALVQTYSRAELSNVKWTDSKSVGFAVADLTEWISQDHAALVEKLNQKWNTHDAVRFMAWFTVARQRSLEKAIADLEFPEFFFRVIHTKPPLAEGVDPVDVLGDYFTNTLMCLDKVLGHVKFTDPFVFFTEFDGAYKALFTRHGSKLAEPPYKVEDFRVDTEHEKFRAAMLLCFFKQAANIIGLENVKQLRSVNGLFTSRIAQILANCVDLMTEEQKKEQLGTEKKPRKKPVVAAELVTVVADEEATEEEADGSSDDEDDAPKKRKKPTTPKKKRGGGGGKKRAPKRKTPDGEMKVHVAAEVVAQQREAAEEEEDMPMSLPPPKPDQRALYIDVCGEMVKNRKVQTESVWTELGDKFVAALPHGTIKATNPFGNEININPGQCLIVLLKFPLVYYKDVDCSKFNEFGIKLRDEVENKTMISPTKVDLDKTCKVTLSDWPIANTSMYTQSNGDYRRVSRLGFTYNPDGTGAMAFGSLDWLSVLIYTGPSLDHLEAEFHKEGMEQYVYRTMRR